MKYKNGKYRFFAVRHLFLMCTVIYMLSILAYIILLFYPNMDFTETYMILCFICLAIFFIVAPFVFNLLHAVQILGIIEIDENGVSCAILGRFRRIYFDWDSVVDITFMQGMGESIFIAVESPVYGKSIEEIKKRERKNKNVIHFALTKEVYMVLKKFIKVPINDLSHEQLVLMGYEE